MYNSYVEGWQWLELSMSTLRSAMPYAVLSFGLATTVAWMTVLGYGTYQMAKWALIWLAELVL